MGRNPNKDNKDRSIQMSWWKLKHKNKNSCQPEESKH